MSSAFLYLAIVAVWAVVLVPMWLRRDTEATTGISRRLLHKREDGADLGGVDHDLDFDTAEIDLDAVAHEAAGTAGSGRPEAEQEPEITAEDEGHAEAGATGEPGGPRRPGRAAVIARRRRRTVGLTLLVLTAVSVAALGLAPWWIIAPPVLLLAGHLTLLRVAVQMDQARAHEEAEVARAEADRVLAEAEQAAEPVTPEPATHEPSAEVLEFVGRTEDEVFDQYAEDGRTVEDRRAVGE
ncbi:hypothetical protein [Actinomadura oligospora]|uniref:divisome protein SepX/GlpR n=1 Tax=Actinomadura oligospora TaxID=111804 RepID=UPI00047CC252|nr:hypothetical protein [Actinomadura oligospora]